MRPSDSLISCGKSGGIPVRNLWLLMLYASPLFRELDSARVAVEDMPDELPDILAELLCRRVEKRIRHSLRPGYRHREEVLCRLRGRVDLLRTEREHLLERGKVACRYDELTVDTVRNRFVLAALEKAAGLVRGGELACRCRSLGRALRHMGVRGERPTRQEVSRERIGRHDAEDGAMLAAARLIFDFALPSESAGDVLLSRPDREDMHWLRKLFEKGVAGFYDVVLSPDGWQVEAGTALRWQQRSNLCKGMDEIFPAMRTDIILTDRDAGRRIVVDTKFTSMLEVGHYREKTLRSGHIYQIYAYLRSQEGGEDTLADTAVGVLLYPAVGERRQGAVVIQGHELRFAAVDLAASAREIREQLLQAVGETSHFLAACAP